MVDRAGLRVLDSSSVLTGHLSSAARSGGPQPHRRLVGHPVFDRHRPSAVGRGALAPPILRCTGEGAGTAPRSGRSYGRSCRLVPWCCHVGTDGRNEHTAAGWSFLRPYLEAADALVFSRRSFAPDWIPAEKVITISPLTGSVLAEEPGGGTADRAAGTGARRPAGCSTGAGAGGGVLPPGRFARSGGPARRRAAQRAASGSGGPAGGAGFPVGPDE